MTWVFIPANTSGAWTNLHTPPRCDFRFTVVHSSTDGHKDVYRCVLPIGHEGEHTYAQPEATDGR